MPTTKINDRGVALDMTLVRNAIKADTRSRIELTRLMKELTDIDNPNSVHQMKQWLADNGMETDSLGKKAVVELLKDAPEPLGKVPIAYRSWRNPRSRNIRQWETPSVPMVAQEVCSNFMVPTEPARWLRRLIQMQNPPAKPSDRP